MNVIRNIYRFFKSVILFPYNLYCLKTEYNNLGKDYKHLREELANLKRCSNTKIDSMQEIIINRLNELSVENKSSIENHFLQIESLLFIYNILPNLKYFPSTRGWAGSPDFLKKIVEIIISQKPRLVVEASSGVSTVVIGLALKKNNYGNSLSLEHDPTYLQQTNKFIEINQIEDYTSLHNCPLVEYEIENELLKWYQTDKLDITDKIDILVIDGPPRKTQKLARYPAIPILFPYLSDRFTILLDDAKRPDEILVIEKWVKFLEKAGCQINIEHYFNYEKGMVILNVNKG